MSFFSLIFYGFIVIFFLIYFLVPKRYRYIVIFIASYIFYGYKNLKMLFVIVAVTVISYGGGFLYRNKKKSVLILSFVTNIFVLLIFKYTDFIVNNFNYIILGFTKQEHFLPQFNIMLPIGLSFIVFQSCTYLTDIYHGNIPVERNIIRYAAFVAFFPTVLSGPIQKSRELLPQIKNPHDFDAEQSKKGTLLFIWGLFEKLLVADNLEVIVNRIYNDYTQYNSAYYMIAAACFSLYIYADFSSYSDMVCGISKIMGIYIKGNFKNPYLSITTQEFWNRWHMSLNSWFLENLYIPLGGNRKGEIRKYVNIFIVFAVSGWWHGSNWHFIAWGIMNGIVVIIGQMTRKYKQRIIGKFGINENVESLIFIKRAVVFYLITLTWVFFRNGIKDSLYIIRKIIFCNPLNFFDSNLLGISGSTVLTVFTIVTTIIFCIFQVKRADEYSFYIKYSRQPMLVQCIIPAFLVCICIFAACSTTIDVNTQFLYFQF